MEADLLIRLVDSESWSVALYCGSRFGCGVHQRMAKAELVSLMANIHFEADQSAEGADKERAFRSWSVSSFRSPIGDCSWTDSGRSYPMSVGFC